MTPKNLDDLLLLRIPEVQEIFLANMQDVVDRAILSEMIRAIELNDVDALMTALSMDEAAFGLFLDKVEDVYREAAFMTAATFPSRIGGAFVFRFNMRNTAVEQELRENSARLVQGLVEESRQVVRVALERGMIEGRNPRDTALDIVGRIDPRTKKRTGGVVGLSQNQESWVANTRQRLLTGDKTYFNLKLRDKRYDKQILKYMSEGKPVPKELTDKIMTSYKNRALKYRADSISRTETLEAMNKAEYRAHKQVVESGKLPENAVKKWWDSASDGRTRASHIELERRTRKNPLELDEPFVTMTGDRLMHPGDTSLGADPNETVQCRCKIRYKVDWTKANG